MKAIVGNQYARWDYNSDVGPQFLIFKEGLEFSDHEEVVEVKVNPKDQDPDTDQIGDQTTIVVGNPIVKDSKAPVPAVPMAMTKLSYRACQQGNKEPQRGRTNPSTRSREFEPCF